MSKPDPALLALQAQIQASLDAAAIKSGVATPAQLARTSAGGTAALNAATQNTQLAGQLNDANAKLANARDRNKAKQATIETQQVTIDAAPHEQAQSGLLILLGAVGGYFLGQAIGRPAIGLGVGAGLAWWATNRPAPVPPPPPPEQPPAGFETVPA